MFELNLARFTNQAAKQNVENGKDHAALVVAAIHHG